MYQYRCRIRLSNGNTTEIYVNASFDNDVRPLVEGMHGVGSLITWQRV